MNSKYYRVLLIFLSFALLFSCNDEDNSPSRKISHRNAQKTIIAYLVGENSLSDDIRQNIQQMMIGYNDMKNDSLYNFLIYIDDLREPRIYELVYNGKKNMADTVCIKRFHERNSLDKEHVHNILAFIHDNYNSPRYGFIWGSHGSGWYPKRDRAIGPDGNLYMDVTELHDAIPSSMYFEFILFDACYMGQIEIAHLFADKTDYILASPTGVPGQGSPYTHITGLLCKADTEKDYIDICKAYSDFYQTRWYSISLIKPRYTKEVAEILQSMLLYMDKEDLKRMDFRRVQHFDGMGNISAFHIISFDIKSLAKEIARVKALPEVDLLYEKMSSALDKLIPYTSNSQNFQGVHINESCGISVYWPQRDLMYANEYYRTNFKWAEDAGYTYLLDLMQE